MQSCTPLLVNRPPPPTTNHHPPPPTTTTNHHPTTPTHHPNPPSPTTVRHSPPSTTTHQSPSPTTHHHPPLTITHHSPSPTTHHHPPLTTVHHSSAQPTTTHHHPPPSTIHQDYQPLPTTTHYSPPPPLTTRRQVRHRRVLHSDVHDLRVLLHRWFTTQSRPRSPHPPQVSRHTRTRGFSGNWGESFGQCLLRPCRPRRGCGRGAKLWHLCRVTHELIDACARAARRRDWEPHA